MDQYSVEIRHLRLVSTIAEHGSITAASRVLNLTQPALSHQLRDLETTLRVPLFIRTARRMILTPAGEHLVHVAHDVLKRVETFERQALEGEFASARGVIRLATECYTAYHWLPAVLREFRERWPHVDLRIAAEHTSSPLAALREGALDVAIVFNHAPEKRVRLEPLFDDELVIVTAPEHRFTKRDYVPIAALADEHLFLYTSADRRSTIVRDLLEPGGVRPREVTRIQLTEAILELVAADFGVAVLAKWAVAPAVRSGSVKAHRIGRSGFSRTWFAALRSRDVMPAYLFDLLDLLRRNLGGINASSSVGALGA
jgi:LysR family transcriptional regulator for metE and metH